MDTSETYIKMCEEATELQFAWKGGLGDVVRHQGKGVIYYTKPSDLLQGDGCIWLPRQDQLQEMVSQNLPLEGQEWNFHTWVSNGRRASIYTSMGQLWLAFVMKEKYNKTWDGEKWEDE